MATNVYQYINHAELLNQDTLFELRGHLARFPFDQAARLLFLQNLYLMHDSSFGDELRKAAFYVADCRALFNMIEGKNYVIQPHERTVAEEREEYNTDRTLSLIDNFLQTLPTEQEPKRPNVPVNPAVDYVAYLMQLEDAVPEQDQPTPESSRTVDLIDNFINIQENEGITLPDNPQTAPVLETPDETGDSSYLTETLARIYIKQGRYSKAAEIIQRLSLKNPKKNAYFADQLRFLEKLIINNKK